MAKVTAAAKLYHTRPAGDQVANTFELLEHILLNLDILDLFRSIRVSHSFAAVINGSKELQRLIFLAPGLPKDHEAEYRVNPFIDMDLMQSAVGKRMPGVHGNLGIAYGRGTTPQEIYVTLEVDTMPRSRRRFVRRAWGRVEAIMQLDRLRGSR